MISIVNLERLLVISILTLSFVASIVSCKSTQNLIKKDLAEKSKFRRRVFVGDTVKRSLAQFPANNAFRFRLDGATKL